MHSLTGPSDRSWMSAPANRESKALLCVRTDTTTGESMSVLLSLSCRLAESGQRKQALVSNPC